MNSILFALVIVAFACTCQAEERMELPPGFNSPQELVNILANEPAAAANARFATANSGSDVITFKDNGGGNGMGMGEPGSVDDSENEAADSEFDPQLGEIDKNIRSLRVSMKESEHCARRLTEQKAELRSLEEQKEHLEKEKEKKILEDKLQKQMNDLTEINRMSRSLRTKFSELKRTQELIRARLSGTRSSLNQLDHDDDVDESDVKDNAKSIISEVDAMHRAQAKILDRIHKTNSNAVKKSLDNANRAHEREKKLFAKQEHHADEVV